MIVLSITPLLLAILAQDARADSSPNLNGMGSRYTSIPLYRNGAGANILKVGVGTPEVVMNLTCCKYNW